MIIYAWRYIIYASHYIPEFWPSLYYILYLPTQSQTKLNCSTQSETFKFVPLRVEHLI